jgi:type II secretory pathway component PulC
VMIEDKKASNTYFLKTGDTINKMKIEEILKDRVILNYAGQRIELK